MLHIDTPLSRQIQDEVARRVGSPLAALLRENALVHATIELGRCFSCQALSANDVLAGGKPLRACTWSPHMWHHQILFDREAKAFARTVFRHADTSSFEISEVVYSSLAAEIEQALSWLEEHADRDYSLRLLLAPAFYIAALWLSHHDEESIVIAKKPEGYDLLVKEKLYTSDEFLQTLAEHNPRASAGLELR